ncbi:hypothetical protein [Marinilactibacillus psychrotolerans]|uniref:hypothetical protein n=1 Tax=Marinilactibacillus psychrotolerans TaxID=191770 RepID=UPI003884BE0F
MNIEILVSTMNRKVDDLSSLVDKMKIRSKAIIINQTDTIGYSSEHNSEMFSYTERGVGKSRNSALLRAKGDICLMADDDMVYVAGYEEVVKKAYEKYTDADFIVFNVRVHYPDRIVERVSKPGRVRFFNSLKYGTVTFSFKRNAILRENVFFSLLFGGGAKYSSGEDTLFLWTCLKKGLKVYAEETIIADVYNYESSWFKGYNEKFYKDKGALFKALEPKWHYLLNLQLAVRKRKEYGSKKSILEILKIMNIGAEEFKNL